MWLEDVNLIYLTGILNTNNLYHRYHSYLLQRRQSQRLWSCRGRVPKTIKRTLFGNVYSHSSWGNHGSDLWCSDTAADLQGHWHWSLKVSECQGTTPLLCCHQLSNTSWTSWFPHSSFMGWDAFPKCLLIFPCLEFRLLCQGEFSILVVSPVNAEPRKEPETTSGSRRWRVPFRPPTCCAPLQRCLCTTPCCFYTLKIKMLLRLLMTLKKHGSVSSTALPGGSAWWQCHI